MGKLIERLHNNVWYGVLFAVLSVASVLFLLYELFVPGASPELVRTFLKADIVIAYIFLVDFFAGLIFVRNKRKYWKQNWLNLVSSIPISKEIYRALRILRFARAIRAVRVGLSAQQIRTLRKGG